MINFQRELDEASATGLLTPATAARLTGAERREPFSIYFELRLLAWLGVTLIVSGVGIVIANNLDRIGPLAIALVLGAAAVGTLLWAAWRKTHDRTSAVDDYLVMLGALLVAADVGFVESQFKMLDQGWYHHFLLIAIVHAAIAYYFDSRSVLSLSIAAFATWVGAGQRFQGLFNGEVGFAVRALGCAAAMIAWREVDRRVRVSRTFEPVFEHFATNFAFFAFVALFFEDNTRLIGIALALALAVALLLYAIRSKREAFAVYALIYGVIAIDVFVVNLEIDFVSFLFVVLSTIGAIIGLFLLHSWFRRMEDV